MHIKKTGRICSKLILVVKEACSMKYYVSIKKDKVNIYILTLKEPEGLPWWHSG